MTLETLQVLGIGDFERAISCLAFSIQVCKFILTNYFPLISFTSCLSVLNIHLVFFSVQDNGRHLVVVDEANEHVISYWEWESKRKLTENKVICVSHSRGESCTDEERGGASAWLTRKFPPNQQELRAYQPLREPFIVTF